MDQRSSNTETEGSFQLQISDLNARLSETGSTADPTTIDLRASQVDTQDSSTSAADCVLRTRPTVIAPEKKLTLFALRLAVLEKSASRIGTLGFIWATVVLLGGFAIELDNTDFWFITVILLIEGTRIFSRSHELEWQHQATGTVTDVGINSFRALKSSSGSMIKSVKEFFWSSKRRRERPVAPHRRNWEQKKMPTRTWTMSEVPLLPYGKWVFISKNVSKMLYWLQLASAMACVVLSMIQLVQHNYGGVHKEYMNKLNRKSALIIFYSLALAEASLFLLEKAYWEWKVSVCQLLNKVNDECDFGQSGMISIKRFFYDTYSKCVNGSIFDGLKMDMVSFSMELLASDSPDEQLIGARILRKFSTTHAFSDDTLQKIGVNLPVMERLVEMLNWEDPQEIEVRYSAAEILSKLVEKRQNSVRIAGIPGAMESISCLLHVGRSHGAVTDEISENRIIFDNENYGSWAFNHLGLLILKKLARDHDICEKIGNTRGLLPKIIDFTHTEETVLIDSIAPKSQMRTIKRSLQVLKLLVSTVGAAGKQLRKEISVIVLTISYIRDILRYGKNRPKLQVLAMEVLTSLAIEDDATESIGSTGGVIKELFNIFFDEETPQNRSHVRVAAGEALSMLLLKSTNNCRRVLKLRMNEKLVRALESPLLRANGARILRNLCAYSGDDCFDQLQGLANAGPIVLEAIMKEQNKLLEVMLGVGAWIFKFTSSQEASNMFKQTQITEFHLVYKLVQILKNYQYPSINVPNIRRYAIELAIWMMKENEANVQTFGRHGLERELESVLDTTSEMESFNIFSATVGVCRHSTTMQTLVETAIKLMAK